MDAGDIHVVMLSSCFRSCTEFVLGLDMVLFSDLFLLKLWLYFSNLLEIYFHLMYYNFPHKQVCTEIFVVSCIILSLSIILMMYFPIKALRLCVFYSAHASLVLVSFHFHFTRRVVIFSYLNYQPFAHITTVVIALGIHTKGFSLSIDILIIFLKRSENL